MDTTDQRDTAEEAYAENLCPECSNSPCIAGDGSKGSCLTSYEPAAAEQQHCTSSECMGWCLLDLDRGRSCDELRAEPIPVEWWHSTSSEVCWSGQARPDDAHCEAHGLLVVRAGQNGWPTTVMPAAGS